MADIIPQLSFTRAAELLDYAQSSITAQINSLEYELNELKLGA